MKLSGLIALFSVDITLYSFVHFLVPEKKENIFNLFFAARGRRVPFLEKVNFSFSSTTSGLTLQPTQPLTEW
jgi:hypothetical protein